MRSASFADRPPRILFGRLLFRNLIVLVGIELEDRRILSSACERLNADVCRRARVASANVGVPCYALCFEKEREPLKRLVKKYRAIAR